MLTLSQTSIEPILSIRDTLPDGRAFYIDIVSDSVHGELMRFDGVSSKMIRIINNDRIIAQKENILLKADIEDCEAEKVELIKINKSLNIQNIQLDLQYEGEQEKNINNTIMMDGYKKQANSGKVMIIVGGIGVGVGTAGILYAVIKNNIK